MRAERSPQAGFTLIELVIGMVVFAIVIVVVISLLAPQARRSVDPILQVRATELAQSLMNEITSKSYDENSDRALGLQRCNEIVFDEDGIPQRDFCVVQDDLGPDGESRSQFNDVDDYNGLTSGHTQNSLEENLTVDGRDLYAGFNTQVSVTYDEDFDGGTDANANTLGAGQGAKLITISVTTPTGETLVFSTYRSNF